MTKIGKKNIYMYNIYVKNCNGENVWQYTHNEKDILLKI